MAYLWYIFHKFLIDEYWFEKPGSSKNIALAHKLYKWSPVVRSIKLKLIYNLHKNI